MAIINGTGKRDSLNGTAAADRIFGYDEADLINGGAGQDTLVGGSGNDTYVVDNSGDVITEKFGDGIDLVRSIAKTYKMGSYVENMTFVGTGGFVGTGNHLDNVITGGAGADQIYGGSGDDTLNGGGGADRLYGGLGADRMLGGLGNDTYYDGSNDTIVEAVNAGIDTVRTTRGSYTLGSNLEHLVFDGSGIFLGTGNSANNRITGGAGADILNGGLGSDTMTGNGGDDTYIVDSLTDTVVEIGGGGLDCINTMLSTYTLVAFVEDLTFTGAGDFVGIGNGAANRLTGGNGNDRLDGMAGADRLLGGLGDDTYVVDNSGDSTTETLGAGTDSVETTLGSWSLWANIERLVYTGTGNFTGTGNILDNEIIGGAGNDTLSGGQGSDRLEGLGGNDTYIVDTIGDTVVEAQSGGIDTVRTALASLTLTAEVEGLVYTGGGTFAGTGNDLANSITGGSGGDLLDGGAGADTLVGGLGNDTYIVDDAGDQVNEASFSGVDQVTTSLASYVLTGFVENLLLTDVTASSGTGNNLDNRIMATSTAGSQVTLAGRGGMDTLDGTLADGRVNFLLELGYAVADGQDSILGFTVTGGEDDDKLLVDAADFGGLSSIAVINQADGNTADSGLGGVAQFIYQQDSMMLWFDADGTGAGDAVVVAVFDDGAFGNALDVNDFILL